MNQAFVDALLLEKIIIYYVNSLSAENKSKDTVKIYAYNLNLFAKFAGTIEIGAVTPLIIREYLSNRATGRKSNTVHQAFRVLRTFFMWCIREEFISVYPMKNIKAPKIRQQIIETYTQEDIQKMMSVCDVKTFIGARNRAIIALLLDTGMRKSELIGLKLDDWNYQQGTLKVLGKGNKERLVHLNVKSRQVLMRYLLIRSIKTPDDQKYLFLSEEKRKLTSGLLNILVRIGRRSGVKKVSIHKFRHSFAIEYLRSGGDPFTLQKLLGHESLEMVQRYLRSIKPDDAIKAHADHSPGDKWL